MGATQSVTVAAGPKKYYPETEFPGLSGTARFARRALMTEGNRPFAIAGVLVFGLGFLIKSSEEDRAGSAYYQKYVAPKYEAKEEGSH
eukprot:PLAT14312.1.p2 GENE.PLAT14312.1~~PLAT14312.1.p2  ORF type:complete len:103 (-),score=16.72 PLAT14312.1:109-372(-)